MAGTPLSGREMVIALKKAQTWGTAVACGQGDGVLFTSFALKQTIDNLKDKAFGIKKIISSDPGKVAVAGSPVADLRYEGLDTLIALCMGTAGAPTIQGAGPAYSYVYNLADNITGLFATIAALKKSDVVFEYPSCKIHGMKIAGKMNEALTITIDIMGDREVLDSVTNTPTTMANVTYPDEGHRIIMNMNQSCYVRINDASAGALSSGDEIAISDFELSWAWAMEQIFSTKSSGGAEPLDNEFPTCTLTLDLPQYNDENAQFFLDWDASTPKKIEIYFKGPLIADTYYYQMTMDFPNALITDADATPTNPGRIPAKLTFDCRGCATAPTGMSGITNPFQISGTNTRTISALATTDIYPPTISIHLPTDAATYSTSASAVEVAGICHDNVGVTSVTYVVTGAGSGSGSAILSPDGSEWSIDDLALTLGSNIVTVTAHDAAAHTTVAVITITRTA